MGGHRTRGIAACRLTVGLLVAAAAVACSGDDGTSSGSADEATTTTAAIVPRAGFDLTQARLAPVPEGGGTPQASDSDLPADYVETEYLLSGVAGIFRGEPNEPATPTGREAAYVTRVLVRAPSDPGGFSGRVVVEPLNTSGGADLDVIWRMAGPMLADAGDAWVGVTVRTNSGVLLQGFDDERYADVDVPVNDVEWDALRQIGGLLKEGGEASPLGDALAERVYLAGYSQSGLDTATFVGAIASGTRMEDGTPVYDGFLPAAHSGSLTPLRSGDAFVPTFVFEPIGAADVPVVDLENQSDVQGFSAPVMGGTYTNPGGAEFRREDSDQPEDRYRLYEIAGSPHSPGGGACDGPPSSFPTSLFVRAAAERLFEWAETGEAPPEAARLDMSPSGGVVWAPQVDDVGNATGGVRSPFVDVPLVRYHAQSDPGALCKLGGREEALDAATLAGLYDSAEDYLDQFTASLDATIEAGFLRSADREEILDLATDGAQRVLR